MTNPIASARLDSAATAGHLRSMESTLNDQLQSLPALPLTTWLQRTTPASSALSRRSGLRASHSFSPDFYLKGFVQYNDDRKTASFNFLWWYHYRPGSDLYVVYNQGWDIELPLDVAGSARPVLSRAFAIDCGEADVLAGAVTRLRAA